MNSAGRETAGIKIKLRVTAPLECFVMARANGGIKMSELRQLKDRIEESGPNGVETAHVHDDYEPAGKMMIRMLINSGEFITRRVMDGDGIGSRWKIFKAGQNPY